MMTTSYGLFGWHVHALFGVVLFLGVVLFIVWAFRALDKKALSTWMLWLLIVGALGVLLTSQFGFGGFGIWGGRGGMMGGTSGFQQVNWQEMAKDMMSDDHSDLTTPEQWRDHMFEEMQEHMGR